MTTVNYSLRAMTEPLSTGGICESLAELERLDRALPDIIDATDDRLDDLLTLLADATELVAQAGRVKAALEQRCAQVMPKNKYESWAAGILAERSQPYSDTWNHSGTARAVAEAAIVDRKTGEVLTDPDAVLNAVVTTLLQAAAPSWRTTVLRQLDIDPEQYRTREKKRRTVRVTRSRDAS